MYTTVNFSILRISYIQFCSVVANGAAGSAAAIVCIGNSDVQATVRLASADVALSSGRAEWGGLIMVLVIATDVSAAIELRLDNLQVVNTFNDGEWRCGGTGGTGSDGTIGTWQCQHV